jgi:hypothetical protein
MMGYLEELQTIALTALFNPAFLALLLILFFAGKFFGKLTRRLNIWKILIVAYFGLFLYAPVRDAGPIIGGVFLLGVASNHVGTLFSVLGWASSLGDVMFALRYKSAYDDIRRREQELEQRERRLKEAELRQAYQQQEWGQRARAGWQQEAKGFRQKPEDKTQSRSSGSRRSGSSQRQEKKQRSKTSHTSPPQNDVQARHLETLGLKPGRDYSPDEIKKAYRRKVMKVHPDAGGSQVEFISVINAHEWLRNNAA